MLKSALLSIAVVSVPLFTNASGCEPDPTPKFVRDAAMQFNIGYIVTENGDILSAGNIGVDPTNPASAMTADCADSVHEYFALVPDAEPMLQVEAGYTHALALGESGRVWAWGYENNYAQLGTTAVTSSCTPLQVAGLSGIVQIEAGGYHNMVLDDSGAVWTWGDNRMGALGRATANPAVPGKVFFQVPIVQIVAGFDHNLALDANGLVWVWGSNEMGELGLGYATSTPTALELPVSIRMIDAGSSTSFAFGTDGRVWGWGSNYEGELALGFFSRSESYPRELTALRGMKSISSGFAHSLGINAAGTLVAWGNNSAGELGNGTNDNSATPVTVNIDVTPSLFFGGYWASMAMAADGSVWSWGRNAVGGLGTGTTGNISMPVTVAY